MGLFNTNLPYTNLHELNLDWLVKEMKEAKEYIAGLQPATALSPMDGIGTIGTSSKYAREDHQHPSDTSKLNKLTNSGSEVDLYAYAGNVQNGIKLTDIPEAGKVVEYDEVNGNVNTGTPVTNTNAINKGYYDSTKYKKVMLYSDGTKICSDKELTTQLSYIQIKALLDTDTNDIELWNGNYILRPEYTTTQSGVQAIWFNATTSLADKTYLYRIAINSNNEVTNDEYELAQSEDIPTPYSLPIASTNTLGGVKVGDNLTIDSDGTLNATGGGGSYTLPIATSERLGGIKVGDNLTIDETTGVLSANPGSYTLPVASSETLGGIKVGDNLTIEEDGTLNATGGGSYTLPIASADTLGGIKISNGLRVDPSTGETDVQPATTSTIGGIIVGSGLSIDTDGVLSIKNENNVGYHNSIYRGKNIQSYYDDGTLFTRISSGSFDDLFVGDYFTITLPATDVSSQQSVTCMLAHFDYYYNCGDSALTTHHCVIVPTVALCNSEMEDSDIISNGYYGSKMHQTTLTAINGALSSVFGSNLVSYRDLLSTADDTSGASMAGAGFTGYAWAWAWQSVTSRLMNEAQVYGTGICSSSFYDYGCAKSQLALFRLDPSKITTRDFWWLSAVASSTSFALVTSQGVANNGYASVSRGVRPLWLIK